MAAPSARVLLGVACVALITSCLGVDDREIVSPPLPATLAPAIQWAGGVVRVSSDGFDATDEPPALSLAGDPLDVVAVGEGWIEYRLPRDVRGALTLDLDGGRPATFQVRVLGFRWVRPLGMDLYGNLLVWPRPERTDRASLLALEAYGASVIRIIGSSAQTILELPGTGGADVRGVGPTYDPELVLLRVGTRTEVWRLRPTPQLVDSLPAVGIVRQAMLLSDSVYVASYHHQIAVADPRQGAPFEYFELHEETQGFVISPTGRYGATRVNGSTLGPPVFSADAADSVVHVDTLSHSDGVDFSPIGDTLYIVGQRRAEPRDHIVLAIDPATGGTVAGVEIPGLNPLNLIRDPFGPWLYVMATSAIEGPRLLVIDARTMRIAGDIATAGYAGCVSECEGALAIGRDGITFVTTGHLQTAPSVVFGFDPWTPD